MLTIYINQKRVAKLITRFEISKSKWWRQIDMWILRREIVKAYDCIGHHKLPLTNANVNDYNI